MALGHTHCLNCVPMGASLGPEPIGLVPFGHAEAVSGRHNESALLKGPLQPPVLWPHTAVTLSVVPRPEAAASTWGLVKNANSWISL